VVGVATVAIVALGTSASVVLTSAPSAEANTVCEQKVWNKSTAIHSDLSDTTFAETRHAYGWFQEGPGSDCHGWITGFKRLRRECYQNPFWTVVNNCWIHSEPPTTYKSPNPVHADLEGRYTSATWAGGGGDARTYNSGVQTTFKSDGTANFFCYSASIPNEQISSLHCSSGYGNSPW